MQRIALNLTTLLVVLLSAGPLPADEPAYIDLSKLSDDARFEFLIGDWTYEFANGKGTASYEKVADNRGVRESVDGRFRDSIFAGSSLTVWDAEKGHHRRKWIDTLGNTLEGSAIMAPYEESKLPAMISSTELNGVKLRHVWYNITRDRFETDLLASSDGGETFKLIRRMPYIRATK